MIINFTSCRSGFQIEHHIGKQYLLKEDISMEGQSKFIMTHILQGLWPNVNHRGKIFQNGI